MLKIILLFLIFSFARDPFVDFRLLKAKNEKVKKTKIIYLGLVEDEPIIKLNSKIIFPLENTSFKVLSFKENFISFIYRNKTYKISR